MRLSLLFLTRFPVRALGLLILLGTSLLAQAQSNATPAIRYVRTDGINPNPATATTWATSTTNLQGAIDASAAGDQVWVATGTYKPGGNANTDIHISFAMKNEVSILGGFAATGSPTLTERNPTSLTTVLSGDIGTAGNGTPSLGNVSDNSYHVIKNSGLTRTAVLDGFVIRDGYASYYGFSDALGGGMYNYSSSPTVTNCSFVGNSAYSKGGGMYNEISNPTLTNCSFLNNSARFGGGMYNYSNSAPTLTNCSFVENSAGFAGAMRNDYYSNSTLTNCSFVSNSGVNSGGGIENYTSSPILTNCNFVGNYTNKISGVAGGMYNNGNSAPTLTNCSFVENSSYRGGGIFNSDNSAPALFNCSFLGNIATFQGGGVNSQDNSSTSLTNCVLFSNGGANTFYNQNNNQVTATYSLLEAGVTGYTDGGNNLTTTTSPFVSPTDARLNVCSPAINTGDNAANTTTGDLDGNPRLVNTTIDMGAYEFQGQPNFPTAITSQPPSVSIVCGGATVSASVTVSGSSPTYQWYKDGMSLGAAQQQATLTLNGVTTTNVGAYSVVITGSCNSVTSTAFNLTVSSPQSPTLTASATSTNQPISVTASGCSGTINWTPQGGSGSASGNIYTFTAPGSYTLSATCTVGSCTSPASTPLSLTILPSSSVPFAVVGVNLISCQTLSPTERQVTFTPQYVGTNGQPILFSVYKQLNFTTQPGPYSLRLDTSNPLITLITQQDNHLSSFNYQWLAACNNPNPNPNRPPTTTGIANQTAQQGQAFQLGMATAFTDPEGQALSFSVSVLPNGLSRTGTVISGTPSLTGVFPITVTVTDPGGLSVATSFQLSVLGVSIPQPKFSLVGVNLISCQTVSPTERQVTFTPQYVGTTGQPILFTVYKQLPFTTQPGPYSLRLDTSNPLMTMIAQQNNDLTSFNYQWLAACNAKARQGALEPGHELVVTVLGNPVVGPTAEVEIRGVSGERVQVELLDLQGRRWHQQVLEQAGTVDRVQILLGTNRGLLVLQVSTASQTKTVKLLMAD